VTASNNSLVDILSALAIIAYVQDTNIGGGGGSNTANITEENLNGYIGDIEKTKYSHIAFCVTRLKSTSFRRLFKSIPSEVSHLTFQIDNSSKYVLADWVEIISELKNPNLCIFTDPETKKNILQAKSYIRNELNSNASLFAKNTELPPCMTQMVSQYAGLFKENKPAVAESKESAIKNIEMCRIL